MRLPPILSSFLFCLSLGAMPCFADPAKVIIDTDFNTIGDDGQVAVMAAQLYAQGTIDLLGFTSVLCRLVDSASTREIRAFASSSPL